jgi:alanyl-tRNA synthetase
VTGPTTEKLYLNDPYSVSFRAHVIESREAGAGRSAVALDRTLFYPESGGQTADVGSIGSLPVIDVQEEDGGRVVHIVEVPAGSSAPAPGEEVEGCVDWPRRFDHMQQHTGQHVLSRSFVRTAGLYTVSFHLGEDTCTIDLEGGGFGADVADLAEELANAIVVENRPVVIKTLPAAEVERLYGGELRRSLPEGVTEARLVEVEEFDVIPCCGTHVRATGELGLIKILKSEKAKGCRRVYFKAGGRALRDYQNKHDIVQSLAGRLTTSTDDVEFRIDKLLADGQRTKKDVKRLSQALAAYETRALLQAAPESSGERVIVRYYPDGSDEFLRMVSAALREAPRTVAVIGAATGAVVCSASDGVAVDFAALAVEPAVAAGGSGGGKGGFAQLKLPDGADVNKFVEEIGNNVKRTLS